MWRLATLTVVLAVLAAAGAAQAATQPLTGPSGTSRSKVLVIGTDGTRFDLVRQLMRAGEVPNLERLADEGFIQPSLLEYSPPEAATLSEVGWASIATGVWPDKHGVNGIFLNNDPRQETKNGFPDFLSRIERVRPRLSTFVASDWSNIAEHKNGGPIFGDAIDARAAITVPEDTIAAWDEGDRQVTEVATRYLREGNPDAGFVYLGVVDESAHLDGSANQRYLQAIRETDRRIGAMLAAIRARPSYLSERWLVIVTTDHGQQNLNSPSLLSHGLGSDLERTSFVAAGGFGVENAADSGQPRVVDIAPTVFARFGIPIESAWNLDGQPFANAPAEPQPVADVRARGRRQLRFAIRAPAGSDSLRSVRLFLPKGLRIGSVALNRKGTVTRSGGSVRVKASAARTLRVRVKLGERARKTLRGRQARLTIVDKGGETTKLTARVR